MSSLYGFQLFATVTYPVLCIICDARFGEVTAGASSMDGTGMVNDGGPDPLRLGLGGMARLVAILGPNDCERVWACIDASGGDNVKDGVSGGSVDGNGWGPVGNGCGDVLLLLLPR